MTTRTQQRSTPLWLLPFLAALIAALAAILGFTTASVSAAVGAETRVGAINVAGEVLVEPPQHVSAGQHPGPGLDQRPIVVATGVAANSVRTFASADAHVADAANRIEHAMPGRVVGVNSQVSMANGLSREVDIDLGDLLVQVKSGNARGLTGQLMSTTASTGRTAIGYAPDISEGAWLNAARQGVPIARTLDELLAIIGELG